MSRLVPLFTAETAAVKVRVAEDGWNSPNPEKVPLVYAADSRWRNRIEFLSGRVEIVAFLTLEWATELECRLIKELWAFTESHIAVHFATEWRDSPNLTGSFTGRSVIGQTISRDSQLWGSEVGQCACARKRGTRF
jgi:nuclear transport factor 2 (NTF2) superfamily protein